MGVDCDSYLVLPQYLDEPWYPIQINKSLILVSVWVSELLLLLTNCMEQNPSWQVKLCLSRNLPHFFEPKSSLPSSQEFATLIYPKPNSSSSHPSAKFHNSFNIIVSSIRRFCNWSLPLASNLLTYYMKHSPWEANRFSASHDVPSILCNLKASLPHSQVPTTCPYPDPARSSPFPHIALPEDPS